MHKFINELVLTFRNKLVRSINTKTLVNITIRVLYTALFHHKAWFCYYYYYYYYTVSQKVVLSLLERKVSFQQKAYNTSVCCRITLRKLEVRICRNFQKKIWVVSHLTKTETSLVMWLNIVTNVARSVRLLPAYMREDVHATHQCIDNDGLVNAMPNK